MPGAARIVPVGDTAILVELGQEIDERINARVINLARAVEAAGIAGIEDIVPTYRSALVHFDPERLARAQLMRRMKALLAEVDDHAPEGRLWRIPVVYGGHFGIDLEDFAAFHGLAPDELIRRHAAGLYRVYMIGFQPGFTYLGGLDPALARSRRADPRVRTPAGSVSIGGIQAAIASVEAPSGWHLLGRTPVRTFLPGRDPTFLLQAGDRVRFEPVPAEDWGTLDRQFAAGGLPACEA